MFILDIETLSTDSHAVILSAGIIHIEDNTRPSYDEMVARLNIGIHQFAKRQMTWFRRMERNGIHIHWLDPDQSTNDQIRLIRESVSPYFDLSG